MTSSGNLLADRLFGYAEALSARGDPAMAADLLGQVVERAPRWASAWLALGAAQEARGDRKQATAAYIKAAAHDADGTLGAALHVARLAGRAEDIAMAPTYIAALFDAYAQRFDRHLVDGLDYRGPAVLLHALDSFGAAGRFGQVVDLGCGTGLMGGAIRARAAHLVGVDLSPGMIAQAVRTGLYDALVVGDLSAFLAGLAPGAIDLVLATDVFVYMGALDSVLVAAARVLRSGGLLAFTVQHSEDASFGLGSDLRFAHSAAYLSGALTRCGLADAEITSASTRREAGADMPGLVVVARRP